MKRTSIAWYAGCAACCWLSAALWLSQERIARLAGIIWLIAAVAWTVRAARALRAGTEEQEDAP